MNNDERRMKNDEVTKRNLRSLILNSSFFVLRSSFLVLVLRSSFFILHLTFPSSAPSQAIIAPAHPSKELGQPADEIHLVDGKIIQVVPLATFPGAPPNIVDPLACESLDKPGSVLEIPAAQIQSILYFETHALKKIDQLLPNPTHAQLQAADKLLQELGRFHQSRRSHPPLAVNPWAELHGRIVDKLHEVRRQRLALFAQTAGSAGEWAEAMRLAEASLSLDSSLRDAVRTLWIRYGTVKLGEGDFAQVRATLNQLDEHFLQSSQADPLRLALRTRAEALAKEARNLPTDQAIVKLEEALNLWPRAPGWRDDLDKLNKTYRVVYVGVRHLPEYLSPATAWTSTEQQALDLLFNRLVQAQFDERLGQRYEPDLVTELPRAEGSRRHIQLRRDAYWSDGDRLTTADVRHTAQLLQSTSAWRDLVEVPRFEGRPFNLSFTLRQGLLDPLAPLRFQVLPQKYRGQPLVRADDPDFAKAPVGSGPFRYVGQRQDGKRTVAVFQTNPCFEGWARKNRGNVREIRMVAWNALGPDLPPPHLVLDQPARSLDALKKMGYAGVYSVPGRRVYFLAVNHRVPSLANQDLRRALSHAIQRDQILQDHFRGPGDSAKLHLPLSGPFPAHCWAACPPPRVPEDPYLPELAKSLAKKAGPGPIRLTLKFPADDPGVKEACTAIAEQAAKLFARVQVGLALDLVPLSPRQMRDALHNHDYELAYHHWDFPDDNFWLWPLFDPHPDALRLGGSNFLGYDNDAKLQNLLRSIMTHRHFVTVRILQQSVHAHVYERMPFIPLWQLPESFAVHPSLVAPNIDPQRVFADVLEWRVNP